MVQFEHVRTLFYSTQSQESESEVHVKEIYTAMRIKIHLNNALYQITAVCFEHEHELVIAELQLVLLGLVITVSSRKKSFL